MWKARKPVVFGLSAAFFRQQPRKEIFGINVDACFNNFPQIHCGINICYKPFHILPLVRFSFYVEHCGNRGRIFCAKPRPLPFSQQNLKLLKQRKISLFGGYFVGSTLAVARGRLFYNQPFLYYDELLPLLPDRGKPCPYDLFSYIYNPKWKSCVRNQYDLYHIYYNITLKIDYLPIINI